MHSASRRRQAEALLASGMTLSACARLCGVARSTLRTWRDGGLTPRASECPRCADVPLHPEVYAALLGYYLGDGCLSQARRCWTLRITCDATYPAIITEVRRLVELTHPSAATHLVPAPGCVVVQKAWTHWTCVLPQHGPGPKHGRPIVLEDWQRVIVEAHPAPFLRGLFHSDGSRVHNRVHRLVAGELRHYVYPRWQFSNRSADIRELCCWALDLVDVPWRRSNRHHISVSTRAGVARLDGLIGLKQ
ncbi:transcriptional regulator [Nocardioides sp.]|uniref:transcriptional regulator n=1 Tax=Nocardioides sp. TaxID=35761 RepID=UPI00286CD13B|nr:transcriptional regulator [Nocardioides sp.]